MGGCASSPAQAHAKPQPVADKEGSYPEDGKKLRTDAALEDVYEIGSMLGEGGFSKVKLATHKETGELFACKIIPLPRPGKRMNEHMSDRSAIMKEIDALLDLDHPNVVGLKEYFVWRNRLYLIMELLQGGELLDAVLEQGHYSESDARTIFRQLIGAVQYLHTHGVVHRDVKLDNLLLVNPTDITHVKIADFGFAKKQHGRGGGLNDMKTVCGTPGYIAPEVVLGVMDPKGTPLAASKQGQHAYGPPCDLWSAGIVLYMLLAGVPPFHDSSEPRLLRSILAGNYSFNDSVWEPVSAEAKDLISKLLVVDPTKRLTCEQVLEHPWMTRTADQDANLPRTAERMQAAITHRRASLRQGSLQRRISEAISASSHGHARATPLGGSPEVGSPRGSSPSAAAAAALQGWDAPAGDSGGGAAADTAKGAAPAAASSAVVAADAASTPGDADANAGSGVGTSSGNSSVAGGGGGKA